MIRKRIFWVWNHLEELIGGISLAVIIFMIFLNVVLRYVFHSPIGWATEISTIMFVWMVMFGIGAAAKYKLHPNIDLISRFFPGRLKSWIGAAIHVIVIVLLIVTIFRGWDYAWRLGWNKLTGLLELRYTYVYLSLPIGFGLMLIRVIASILSDLRPSKDKPSAAPERNNAGVHIS